MTNKTGIIIQARLGSTRFPEKLLQPFHDGKALIDIFLEKFVGTTGNIPVILATTTNTLDDKLVNHCKKHAFPIFRGSEHDVLKRFIDAGKLYEFDYIIRICSDNPFFDVEGTLSLLENMDGQLSYISYKMADGRPSIKSHLGFWGEVVSLQALMRARQQTEDPVYLQHVTNYIYEYPEIFPVKLVDAPSGLANKNNIRLTLDTPEDYHLLRKMYNSLIKENVKLTPENVIGFLEQHMEFIEKMKKQIQANTK